MTTYKATILEHHLWVVQPSRGSWYLCITGSKPVRDDHGFASLDDAKRIAHFLAHWHIEGKPFCDCTNELCWEPEL